MKNIEEDNVNAIDSIKVQEIAGKINYFLKNKIPIPQIWKDIHKNDSFFINMWENMSKQLK